MHLQHQSFKNLQHYKKRHHQRQKVLKLNYQTLMNSLIGYKLLVHWLNWRLRVGVLEREGDLQKLMILVSSIFIIIKYITPFLCWVLQSSNINITITHRIQISQHQMDTNGRKLRRINARWYILSIRLIIFKTWVHHC